MAAADIFNVPLNRMPTANACRRAHALLFGQSSAAIDSQCTCI